MSRMKDNLYEKGKFAEQEMGAYEISDTYTGTSPEKLVDKINPIASSNLNLHNADIRIPLKEYSYIELHTVGTPEKLKALYDQMYQVCEDKAGLSEKDFQKLVDRYLEKGDMEESLCNGLSPLQAYWVDVTKRAINRLNYRSK